MQGGRLCRTHHNGVPFAVTWAKRKTPGGVLRSAFTREDAFDPRKQSEDCLGRPRRDGVGSQRGDSPEIGAAMGRNSNVLYEMHFIVSSSDTSQSLCL